MNYAELMLKHVLEFRSDVLTRNQAGIESTISRVLEQIKEKALSGYSEIAWLDLMKGDDANIVRECNLEVCRLLQLEGFTITKNTSLKDFCWDQRSSVTVSWSAK